MKIVWITYQHQKMCQLKEKNGIKNRNQHSIHSFPQSYQQNGDKKSLKNKVFRLTRSLFFNII